MQRQEQAESDTRAAREESAALWSHIQRLEEDARSRDASVQQAMVRPSASCRPRERAGRSLSITLDQRSITWHVTQHCMQLIQPQSCCIAAASGDVKRSAAACFRGAGMLAA